MKATKEKVSMFEHISYDDPEYAQKVYEKECGKMKFKGICFAVSIPGSIGGIMMNVFGVSNDFATDIIAILMLIAIIATLLSGPAIVLKTVWKVVKFGWYIIPFYILDLFGIILGFYASVMCFFTMPSVFAGINLYQSYVNKMDLEKYLALNKAEI